MQRLFATFLASTTMLTAAPALASSHGVPDFCEHAFLPVDVNETKLSKEEIKELRDAEYESLDANKDGTITREEMVNCIGKQEKKAREAAIEFEKRDDYEVGNWSDLDLKQAEQLSGEEFAELAREAWQDSPAAAQETFTFQADAGTEAEFAAAAIQRFKMQDANNDGILTKEEYETSVSEMKWSEEAINERFDALDVDESGGISPQEYRAAGTWMAEAGAMNTEQETGEQTELEQQYTRAAEVRRFKRMDTNDDGMIDREEFATPWRKERWSEEKINERFAALDVDETGGISPQEYRGAATWLAAPGALKVEGDDAEESAGIAEDDAVVPLYFYYIEML